MKKFLFSLIFLFYVMTISVHAIQLGKDVVTNKEVLLSIESVKTNYYNVSNIINNTYIINQTINNTYIINNTADISSEISARINNDTYLYDYTNSNFYNKTMADTRYVGEEIDPLSIHKTGENDINGTYNGDFIINTTNSSYFNNIDITSNTPHTIIKKTGLFDNVFVYRNGTGVWGNYTAEARTTAGSVFTLFTVANDVLYLGKTTTFDKAFFDLGTLGSASTDTFYYSKSDGSWGTLSVTDGTSGFTSDGVINFTIPIDWGNYTVNGANSYWLKIQTGTSTATDPTAYLVIQNDNSPIFSVFSSEDETTVDFEVNQNGGLTQGYAPGYYSNNFFNLLRSTYISGILTSTNTIQSSIAPTLGYSSAFLAAASDASETYFAKNSASSQYAAQGWNGTVSYLNSWSTYVNQNGNDATKSAFTIMQNYKGDIVKYLDVLRLSSEGDLFVSGGDYNSTSSLSNGAFNGAGNWTKEGDFAYTTSDWTYTHSTGEGKLRQVTANMTKPLKPNTYYSLTYALGVATTTGVTKLYVSNETANENSYFLISTTEYPITFKTNQNPENFTIVITSASSASIRIDDIQVYETIGGSLGAGNLVGTGNSPIYSNENGTIQRLNQGITQEIQVIKSVDFGGSSVTYCNVTYSMGIAVNTTC